MQTNITAALLHFTLEIAMFKKFLHFNLLNTGSYSISLLSLFLIATTYGGDRSYENYWVLNGFIILAASAIYPLRELVCTELSLKDKFVELSVSRKSIIAFSLLTILFAFIQIVIFLAIDGLEGGEVFRENFLLFLFLLLIFSIHEFFIAIVIATGGVRYPIYFRTTTASITIASIIILDANAFFILTGSVGFATLIGISYCIIYLTKFKFRFRPLDSWSNGFRFFTYVLIVNVFAQAYVFFYRNELYELNSNALAAFQYAFSLFAFGLNLISIPATNYLWVRLSFGNLNGYEFVYNLFGFSLALFGIILVMIPVIPFVIEYTLGRGSFDQQMVGLTSNWLKVMLFALPFVLITQSIYRIFLYSKSSSFVFLTGCGDAIGGSVWLLLFRNESSYQLFFLVGSIISFMFATSLFLIFLRFHGSISRGLFNFDFDSYSRSLNVVLFLAAIVFVFCLLFTIIKGDDLVSSLIALPAVIALLFMLKKKLIFRSLLIPKL